MWRRLLLWDAAGRRKSLISELKQSADMNHCNNMLQESEREKTNVVFSLWLFFQVSADSAGRPLTSPRLQPVRGVTQFIVKIFGPTREEKENKWLDRSNTDAISGEEELFQASKFIQK